MVEYYILIAYKMNVCSLNTYMPSLDYHHLAVGSTRTRDWFYKVQLC